jgi:hypothetical protein
MHDFEDIKSRRKILGRITHDEIEWLIDELDRLQWHKNCAETPVPKDREVLTRGRSGNVSVARWVSWKKGFFIDGYQDTITDAEASKFIIYWQEILPIGGYEWLSE